jgi:hypothetical protein
MNYIRHGSVLLRGLGEQQSIPANGGIRQLIYCTDFSIAMIYPNLLLTGLL